VRRISFGNEEAMPVCMHKTKLFLSNDMRERERVLVTSDMKHSIINFYTHTSKAAETRSGKKFPI
jgi:hypothetical protein